MFGLPPNEALSLVNSARIWFGAIGALFGLLVIAAQWFQIELQNKVSAERAAEFAALKKKSEEDIAATRLETARALERAGQLEVQAAEARERLATLQSHLTARRLTRGQFDALRTTLAGRQFSIWLTTVGTDLEAAQFHDDLMRALKEIGLEVRMFRGYDAAYGVLVSNETSEEAQAIRDALTKARIPFQSTDQPAQQRGAVLEVIIGSKPHL